MSTALEVNAKITICIKYIRSVFENKGGKQLSEIVTNK